MTMTTLTFAWHRMENILFSNLVKYKEQTQQVPISTTIFWVAYPKSWTVFWLRKIIFKWIKRWSFLVSSSRNWRMKLTSGVVSYYTRESELLWRISEENQSPVLMAFDDKHLAINWHDRTWKKSWKKTSLKIYK